MEPQVIALLHDLVQWIIGAVVTLGVPWIGYLSLRTRSRVTELEKEVAEWKTDHQKCIEERKLDQELLATPWPSDPNDFLIIVSEVRSAMEKAGMGPVDQRLVARILRQHELKQARLKMEQVEAAAKKQIIDAATLNKPQAGDKP
jgi:hypothetical protein